MMKCKLNSKTRTALVGMSFTLPLVVGLVFFLLTPLIQSIQISLGDIKEGAGFVIVYSGLENFRRALTLDAEFLQSVIDSMMQAFSDVPVIVIVSFLLASLLKSPFPGRTAYRVAFFLPLIMSAGVMAQIQVDDLVSEFISPSRSMSSMTQSLSAAQQTIQELLLNANIPEQLTTYILTAQRNILSTLNQSSIQTLIFLAALQSISPSLYEASAIEGATAWEEFWKITVPMVSPQLLVVVIYTTIESFVGSANKTMMYINNMSFSNFKYGYAAALAWVYFVEILVVVGILYLLLKRLNKNVM